MGVEENSVDTGLACPDQSCCVAAIRHDCGYRRGENAGVHGVDDRLEVAAAGRDENSDSGTGLAHDLGGTGIAIVRHYSCGRPADSDCPLCRDDHDGNSTAVSITFSTEVLGAHVFSKHAGITASL